MGQAPKTDLLLAFMTGSSPGDTHVWTYCRNGCTDGTASNQKLLKLQLNTQDWIQRGVTGRKKVTTGHKILTSSAERNQVHLCLLVAAVFGFSPRCGGRCSCRTKASPTGDGGGRADRRGCDL